jgi:3-dehydroquinate synthase
MAYSATLANMRGLLSDEEHRRLLNLFSRAGLSMDHEMFDEDMLDKATQAILKTRDGLLRAAVPNPIGTCVFLNDVSAEEMNKALRKHKELMKEYPRNGEGLEAYVDASDTGYTQNDVPVEDALKQNKVAEKLSNGKTDGLPNGKTATNNGVPVGLQNIANGYSNGYKN